MKIPAILIASAMLIGPVHAATQAEVCVDFTLTLNHVKTTHHTTYGTSDEASVQKQISDLEKAIKNICPRPQPEDDCSGNILHLSKECIDLMNK